MSQRTRNLRPKNEGAEVARSICPYCAVGCGQLVFHRDGKIISIEGDPESPISRGHLCPKGAASYELLTHPARATKVKYRAPHSSQWEEMDLDDRHRARRAAALGIAQPHLARGRRSHHRRGASRRRHARHRRELSDQETLHRGVGDGLPEQSGSDMTQLHGARSGHHPRPRRRNDSTAGPRQRRRHPHHGIVDGREPSRRIPVGPRGA